MNMLMNRLTMTTNRTGTRALRLASLAAVLLATVPAASAGAQEIEIRGRLAGAAGAEVVLRPLAGAAGREEVPVRVRTGEDGSFRLLAPGPGMWRLEVRSAGSVPLVNDLRPLLGRRDLGEVALPKARRQAVRVTDAQGAGVAGFSLAAGGTVPVPREMRGSGWSLGDRSAVTDEEGRAFFLRAEDERFYVAGVADGSYAYAELGPEETAPAEIVRRPLEKARVVDAAGRPAAGVLGSFRRPSRDFGRSGDDGALLLPTAAELAFADAGGPLESEVRPSGDALVVHLRSPRTVAGRVVDARTGDGVAGAFVWTAGAFTVADPRGAFALRLGAGTQVQAAASGYVPATWGRRGAGSGPWDPFAGEVTIALLSASSLAGTVVDPDGRGLSGAVVRADAETRHGHIPTSMYRRGWTPPAPPAESSTDRDGRFELQGLPPADSYRLLARCPGFAPAVVDAEPPGPEAEPVRIVLEPGLEAFGRVVDAGRRPIAGAQVTITGTGARNLSSRAETDAAGRFVFTDLGPGPHRLEAWAEGFASAEVSGLEISRDGEADLGALVLEPAFVLEGRVVDAEGRPLAGAGVWVFGGSRRGVAESAASGDDGRFEIGDLPRGETLMVGASLEGYQEVFMEVALAAGAEPLEVVMTRGASLRGRVVDAAGRPAPGATVTVERRRGAGSSTRSLKTEEDGQFTLAGDEPGPVSVSSASAQGFGRGPTGCAPSTRISRRRARTWSSSRLPCATCGSTSGLVSSWRRSADGWWTGPAGESAAPTSGSRALESGARAIAARPTAASGCGCPCPGRTRWWRATRSTRRARPPRSR